MLKKIVLSLLISVCFVNGAKAIETKAKYAILMDYDTGDYLFTKQHQYMAPPASMSKLMTVYLLLEKIEAGQVSMDDEFVVSENAWKKGGAATGGSTMFLPIGKRVKVSDLLRGIIVQSGNDACIVVAENLAGSEKAFAEEMNQKAADLGMVNSSFANSNGLPNPKQRMSVEDLAILSKRLIKDFPQYYGIFSEKTFTYNGIKQNNRNPLLSNMYGADGLKTGHTEEAGYGLAASVVRGNRRIIGVISGMKSMKERSEETEKLMTWGFRNFSNYKIISQDKSLGKIPVWMGETDLVSVEAQKSVVMTLTKSDMEKVKVYMEYESPIKAPISKGQVLGQIEIVVPERDVVKIPLIASEDVAKKGFFGRIFANLNYLLFGVE